MLRINVEKVLGGTDYYSVSGTDGNREYYRIGHFHSKEQAKEQISILIGNKIERRKDTNGVDMQDI